MNKTNQHHSSVRFDRDNELSSTTEDYCNHTKVEYYEPAKKALTINFFVFAVDPMAADERQRGSQSGANDGSQVWDRRREVWRKVAFVVAVYIFAKTMLMITSYMDGFMRLKSEYSTDYAFLCYHVGTFISGSINFVIFALNPTWARYKPYELIFVRFMLNPLERIQQMDSNIREQIDFLIKSIDNLKLKSILEFDYFKTDNDKGTHTLVHNLDRMDNLRRAAISLKQSTQQFYPSIYGGHNFKLKCILTYAFAIFGPVSGVVGAIAIFLYELSLLWVEDQMYRIKTWTVWDILSGCESFITLVMLIWYNVILIMVTVAHAKDYVNQIYITKAEMEKCLKRTVSYNSWLAKEPEITEGCIRQQPRVSYDDDTMFLVNLIKYWLLHIESRKYAKSISQLLTLNSVMTGTATVGLVILNPVVGSNFYWVKMLTFFLIYFYANFILFYCAHLLVETNGLKVYIWSILAEIRFRQVKSKQSSSYHNDPLSILWLKAIKASNMDDGLMAISILNARITPRLLLEFSFVTFSLITILMQH